MDLLQPHEVTCPYCWESITLTLDLSEAQQSYVEDCPVCCRPMAVSFASHDGVIDALTAEPAD